MTDADPTSWFSDGMTPKVDPLWFFSIPRLSNGLSSIIRQNGEPVEALNIKSLY